ncbi:hypothetical protein GCM10022224_090540 [Nonomuraea antimicrobica]|uniref:Ricin B lectin domain-containing protein n=1 Tax=Nonomuraea antimicrobica TaxID=561173 RepID=A0ABP7DZD2_9ACTN
MTVGVTATVTSLTGGGTASVGTAKLALFELVNFNAIGPDKCLAIGSSSKAAGAAAIHWACDGGQEQLWRKVSEGANDGWRIQNVHSGLWLAVGRGSDKNGAPVIQWQKGDGLEQYWAQRML